MLATVVVALATTFATLAAPSVARAHAPSDEDRVVVGSERATDGGGYYDVLEDGTVLYGGDMSLDCRTVPQRLAEGLPSTRRVIEACAEAGFPPEGPLPETGGPPLPSLLASIAPLLLLGAWLLTTRASASEVKTPPRRRPRVP